MVFLCLLCFHSWLHPKAYVNFGTKSQNLMIVKALWVFELLLSNWSKVFTKFFFSSTKAGKDSSRIGEPKRLSEQFIFTCNVIRGQTAMTGFCQWQNPSGGKVMSVPEETLVIRIWLFLIWYNPQQFDENNIEKCHHYVLGRPL